MLLAPLALLLTVQTQANLPTGVRAVWDMASAWRESTPTRERVCLNGLWRWQPSTTQSEAPPVSDWGWFKVPGCWPGIEDYLQKDCQTVIPNPAWGKVRFGEITAAWYQREFTVPHAWKGRRISIQTSYVNSLAMVFVDDTAAGHISFPAGEVDLTGLAKPGERHLLSIQAIALPLKGVMESYSDTNAAKEMKATVARRGLCGDVFLVSTPQGARIDRLRVETSVRKWQLTVRAKMDDLEAMGRYRLKATVLDHGKPVKSLTSAEFRGGDAPNGEFAFAAAWKPAKLWDVNTPGNQFELSLELVDGSGKRLDTHAPTRFGFRELWIKGRDFILNGTRIFWSCVPVDNAAISAGLASYGWAKETLRRLKSFGINMVYTHNYDCEPGSYLAFDELLRAADDVGILVAFTQPHFSDYDWSAPGADSNNGYARHAQFFVDKAGSHPCVVAYSTSHNATGYNEAGNPNLIDGIYGTRDSWAANNMKKAVRAETIIERLDPTRFVYHHSSGNLGSIYSDNFYLNFVPIQELDDWFQHWATVGVKPAFLVEYGVPFSWDWLMYRGWYKGVRTFGNAQVPWEYCMAEWNAQFLGDQAYEISDSERRNLRWEAPKFRGHQEWYRWDYPSPPGSVNADFEDQQRVWAEYTTDNWRAFRTWGLSGTSPWEIHGVFWRLKPDVKRGRVNLPTDWGHLQRPGYSPDYVEGRYERRDVAYTTEDWVPTTGGRSLLRNNQPVLAYIGGKHGEFTEKGHNFRAGETVQKQIIVVNNSREPIRCSCTWSLNLATPMTGSAKFGLPTGVIKQFPIDFPLPAALRPGHYQLSATVEIANRETQSDTFAIDVLPPSPAPAGLGRIAIYDPAGETTKFLSGMGITGTAVSSGADLSPFDLVIIGKGALTVDGPGIDLSRVRTGLKVIVFEQSSEVLEGRFGFRVQEYGLRNVYARIPDSPILSGLDAQKLRDWRGASTLLPPQLKYVLASQFDGAPAIVRTGLLLPHVWRCGNRGDVASVLIEKPAAGDFRYVLDGGFSLQYSPLLEYREGQGVVVFCQMDVTGRTEADPAADTLGRNLLSYVGRWHPAPERKLVVAGEEAAAHLVGAGFRSEPFNGALGSDDVLVVSADGVANASRHADQIGAWLRNGGHALTVGLDGSQISRVLGLTISTQESEYINGVFSPPSSGSGFEGIGPADVYNRDPRRLPLISGGAEAVGSGILGSAAGGRALFLQLAPWSFSLDQQNTRRVFRHSSVTLARLLGNLGVHGSPPLLARFSSPVSDAAKAARWRSGFYLDETVDTDDPYRFFGW